MANAINWAATFLAVITFIALWFEATGKTYFRPPQRAVLLICMVLVLAVIIGGIWL